MSYNLLSSENAYKIKTLLLSTPLINPINITIKEIGLTVNIDGVSESIENDYYNNDMDLVYFMKAKSLNVLRINDNLNKLFYNIGEWAYETRINSVHITLGSDSSKFHDYFCQLELSQSVEDEKYIYILKNLTKLAGKGSIARLNKGLGRNKEAKHERRNQLVQELAADVISYDGQEWLCIDKISKESLEDKSKHIDIYYSFINKFLRYAFAIEKIVL